MRRYTNTNTEIRPILWSHFHYSLSEEIEKTSKPFNTVSSTTAPRFGSFERGFIVCFTVFLEDTDVVRTA